MGDGAMVQGRFGASRRRCPRLSALAGGERRAGTHGVDEVEDKARDGAAGEEGEEAMCDRGGGVGEHGGVGDGLRA